MMTAAVMIAAAAVISAGVALAVMIVVVTLNIGIECQFPDNQGFHSLICVSGYHCLCQAQPEGADDRYRPLGQGIRIL